MLPFYWEENIGLINDFIVIMNPRQSEDMIRCIDEESNPAFCRDPTFCVTNQLLQKGEGEGRGHC